MKSYNKLDSAAKLYPSVTNKNNTSVFRISVVLNENIDANLLQIAVNMIFERFKLYFMRLKSGVFWNYFDYNTLHFTIEKESECPCNSILAADNKGYILKVLYYNNRISVEAFHSITDGSGVLEFTKSLVYYYLTIKHGAMPHENKVLLYDEKVKSNYEDSFLKYFKRFTKEDKQFIKKKLNAFKMDGKKYKRKGNSVVVGLVSVNALKDYCKLKNCTITAFLSALLIKSIYDVKQKHSSDNKPIVIALPVNLRKTFKSDSLKNFFGLTHLSYTMSDSTNLDDIIIDLSAQLIENTSEESLGAISKASVRRSLNIFSKNTPLVLKNIFLPYFFSALGEKKKTVPISNMGNVLMPQETYKYISHFEFILYPTKLTHISIGACSFNDKLALAFTRSIIDADLIRYFFMQLKQITNTDISVYSNMWGENDE